MRIYNKSTRSFILLEKDVTDGGRKPTDELGVGKTYFDPDCEVEVSDELGKDLLRKYPKELKELREHTKKEKAKRKG